MLYYIPYLIATLEIFALVRNCHRRIKEGQRSDNIM